MLSPGLTHIFVGHSLKTMGCLNNYQCQDYEFELEIIPFQQDRF